MARTQSGFSPKLTPLTAGIAAATVVGAAATYMLVDERRRKKVMSSISDFRDGFMAKFQDSSEGVTHMMKMDGESHRGRKMSAKKKKK